MTFESNIEACITDTPLRMHTGEGMATNGKVATGVMLMHKSLYSVCKASHGLLPNLLMLQPPASDVEHVAFEGFV
jgi:hypothetical protein